MTGIVVGKKKYQVVGIGEMRGLRGWASVDELDHCSRGWNMSEEKLRGMTVVLDVRLLCGWHLELRTEFRCKAPSGLSSRSLYRVLSSVS